MLKSVLVASVCGLLISAGPIAKIKTSLPLAGDYVEARTASVFCGACHFNGEYMSTGNDAVAAWHFTSGRDDASIEFGTAPSGDAAVCCYVRDNGAGFDPAYADKLFLPFQRLHAARDFPGTGTGLASVRQIVERHRGQVWAEGTVGAGATFYFTLDGKESA